MPHAHCQTTDRMAIPLGVIVENPKKYNQESVITTGKVMDAYNIGVICSYILEDKGHQVLVNSKSDCPNENERYLVQGNLSVSTDGSEIILEEIYREPFDMSDQTKQHKDKVSPPPPPKVAEILNIVEGDIDIKDELIIDEVEFDFDMEIEEFGDEEDAEEEVFFIVEDMPEFQGGSQNNFRTYIQENLIYPEIAKENNISGKVFVQLVVNSKGDVIDVKVVRGVDDALDKEAIRVVKSSPKWTPGMQRGRPVNVQFIFPVNFTLQ